MTTLAAPLPPCRWPAASTGSGSRWPQEDGDDPRPDALVVTTPANIRWLTGFTGSAGVLLVGPATAPCWPPTAGTAPRPPSSWPHPGSADEVELAIGGVAAQRESLAAAALGASRRRAWRPTT